MAGEFSTEGAALALDALTGRTTLTSRTMYLVLLTAAPTDATTMATMTELTTPGTNGYDREICAWDAATGDPSSADNTSLITFGPFTADLGNVTCTPASKATLRASEARRSARTQYKAWTRSF